jgi:hypothetical protein
MIFLNWSQAVKEIGFANNSKMINILMKRIIKFVSKAKAFT